MVFVPPDRTVHSERTSRLAAVALTITAALACLCIVAFGGDGGSARIAVVHRAGASATPAPRPTVVRPAGPPRTYPTLLARFPLPAGANRVPRTRVATWHVPSSMATVRAFYVHALLRLGLRWHPVAVREGTRLTGWAGTVDTRLADVIARVSVRTSGRDSVRVTVHR